MLRIGSPAPPAPLQATDGAFNALALTGKTSIERSEAFNASYTCDEKNPNVCWRSESDFDTGDIAWWVVTSYRYRTHAVYTELDPCPCIAAWHRHIG